MYQMHLLQYRIVHATDAKGLVKGAAEDLSAFSTLANSKFLEAVKQLVEKDTKASNASTETYDEGTLPALADEATRNDRDTLETPPIARTGHFAFALMDLIQQHLHLFDVDMHFSQLVELVLDLVRNAQRSFLRIKALELLLHIGRLEGVGLAKVETYFVTAMRKETGSGNLKRVAGIWQIIKKRAQDMDAFREQLSTITVFRPQKVLLSVYWAN